MTQKEDVREEAVATAEEESVAEQDGAAEDEVTRFQTLAADYEDRWKRSAAEFINYKRRTEQASGAGERITFTGLVANDEVARYAAVADIFALPSLLEALPTVAVEALASGTPVVSADHPGGVELHELFADRQTQTGAAVFPSYGRVCLRKTLEKLGHLFRSDSDARVANDEA